MTFEEAIQILKYPVSHSLYDIKRAQEIYNLKHPKTPPNIFTDETRYICDGCRFSFKTPHKHTVRISQDDDEDCDGNFMPYNPIFTLFNGDK